MVEHATENRGVSGSTPLLGTTAEVAEWQTRQSQKLLGGNSHAGSSPAFGTNAEWCSGSTRDFGSFGLGSIPSSAATLASTNFPETPDADRLPQTRAHNPRRPLSTLPPQQTP